MAKQKYIKDIALIVADEFGIYPHVAEAIINSEFRYLKKHMEDGFTYPMRLIKLGAFIPRKRFTKYSTIKEYFQVHGSNNKNTY